MRRHFSRILFLLALVLFWTGPIYALTLAQLRTEIRLRIKDSNTSRQRYSDTQITNILNEGQRDINAVTWERIAVDNVTLVAGSAGPYTIGTSIMGVYRVNAVIGNVSLPKVERTQLDADANYGDWSSSQAVTPQYFYVLRQTPGSIYFYPTPSTSGAAYTVSTYYNLSDLVSDSDTPFDGDTKFVAYHDLLIYHACMTIFLIEGEFDKARYYQTLYESRLHNMATMFGNKPVEPPLIPTAGGTQ